MLCSGWVARKGQHYHTAVKLKKLRRWSTVKSYLRKKEEALESPDHSYLSNSKPPRTQKASEKKASDGRINTSERSKECASKAVHNPRQRKRLSASDLSEIIVQKVIKTITELLALAQEQKDEGKYDRLNLLSTEETELFRK